jgi:hypothetical protein
VAAAPSAARQTPRSADIFQGGRRAGPCFVAAVTGAKAPGSSYPPEVEEPSAAPPLPEPPDFDFFFADELDVVELEDTPAAAPPELLAGEVFFLPLVLGFEALGVCLAGVGAVVVGVPFPPPQAPSTRPVASAASKDFRAGGLTTSSGFEMPGTGQG